jgi:hypothetical protein
MRKMQKVFSIGMALIFMFYTVAAQTQKKKQKGNKAVTEISLSLKCPCNFPPLEFEGNTVKLTDKAKALLIAIAKVVKQQPQAVLNVNLSSVSTKSSQGNCFRRIEQIKNYLVEIQGISYDRIITHCDITDNMQAANQCLLDCN